MREQVSLTQLPWVTTTPGSSHSNPAIYYHRWSGILVFFVLNLCKERRPFTCWNTTIHLQAEILIIGFRLFLFSYFMLHHNYNKKGRG